jgi:uncharacterized protein (TIGR02265 family)
MSSSHHRNMSELVVDLEPGFAALDLERRLAETPTSAHSRGLFFRLAEQAVAERSPELAAAWRAATGYRSRWAFRMYPTRDFIREQAVAAVLLEPDDPGKALRAMWRVTPRLSPLIRADGFMRYMTGSDPMRALTWVARNRRMMCDYGDWRVEPTGSHSAILHIESEYTWIEHCHVAGAEGTLERCGVSPSVTAELDGLYSGKLRIRWE